MRKLTSVYIFSGLLICVGLTSADALSAELEGALQYPPASVSQDAQPPPPARMLPQPIAPRRTQFGFSGSSVSPSPQRFYVHPPVRSEEHPGAPPRSGNGG
jgi:hypothetical protein